MNDQMLNNLSEAIRDANARIVLHGSWRADDDPNADYEGPWFLIDESTSDFECNHPGELIDKFSCRFEACKMRNLEVAKLVSEAYEKIIKEHQAQIIDSINPSRRIL